MTGWCGHRPCFGALCNRGSDDGINCFFDTLRHAAWALLQEAFSGTYEYDLSGVKYVQSDPIP